MDDEQTAAWPEDAVGGRKLGTIDALEPGPGTDDRVGRGVGDRPRILARERFEPGRPRACGSPACDLVGSGADERHVTVDERAESFEGAIDLALPIDGGCERVRGSGRKAEREVRHRAEG